MLEYLGKLVWWRLRGQTGGLAVSQMSGMVSSIWAHATI